MAGTLYLIPVPLGPTPPEDSLPANVCGNIRPLTHFVVEQAKTARAFLKAAGTDSSCRNCSLKN
jgi:16S rRNA (cytidine1402-2'-O)-methyltransferase